MDNMNKLIINLPMELIYIIMSYSYEIQPFELRNDIISYVESRKKVEIIFINRYGYGYNNNLFFSNKYKYYSGHLSFQIYSYICGIKSLYSDCQDKFYSFFRRCYMFKNICSNELLWNLLQPHLRKNCIFNANILWGLLTIEERNQFIDINMKMDSNRMP